ncbi:MAG: hypothetical protein KTR29_07330 [Rhodothermaceae bacterium]|nr:hypothetical protein [Rhodothermaceae bacterium]
MNSDNDNSPNKPNPILVSFILAETTSILIAVAMAFTPSISGSSRTLAHYFMDDPSFIQIALVYYILVNIILSILAVIFVVWIKSKR